MQVATARFGVIEVAESEILRFPKGILGFPEIQQYALLPHAPGSPFQFLQAVTEPELTFVVSDPVWFRPDYRVDLYPDDLAALKAESVDDLATVVILTLPRGGGDITANLLAPLVIHPKTRLGKQLVLSESAYSTRHILREELDRAQRIGEQSQDLQYGQALRTVG